MPPCRIAVIGLGEIGLKRHLPLIAAHPGFEIVASAKRHPVATTIGGRQYRDYREMLAAESAIEAVAICTPPEGRSAIALDAIAAGKHVLLEKPPFATLAEYRLVRQAARRGGVSLLGAWHSQFNPAVERARDILADEQVAGLEMIWNEDVAVYHPGQEWIWQPGGFGVFDAGINGISILTQTLPEPLVVRAATLRIPRHAHTPIAVDIEFAAPRQGDRLHAEMDWRVKDAERSIAVLTRSGHRLWMPNSGRRLELDGTVLCDDRNLEYQRIYDRFAELIASGESQLDEKPLAVVADAYLIGRTLADDTVF